MALSASKGWYREGWNDFLLNVRRYPVSKQAREQAASVILSPFNLMSDFAIRLGHATERAERDLKSIGAKANVIKGETEGGQER